MSSAGVWAAPPDQDSKPNRFSKFRYVPLLVLLIFVITVTLIGAVHKFQRVDEPALPVSHAPDGERLPAECAPPYSMAGTAGTFSGEADEPSEAVWQAHAAELEGYYLEGQDGNIFLGEMHHHNLSQAIGRSPLSHERLGALHAYFNDMRAELEAVGTELYIVVAPAKWELYPNMLPEWMQELRSQSRFDQLKESFSDLPIIDVRTSMAVAAERAPVYSRLNSHWTDYGAYAAWQQVAACVNSVHDNDALVLPELDSVASVPDRNEFEIAGLSAPARDDWTVPQFAQPPYSVRFSDGQASFDALWDRNTDMLELPMETMNGFAENSETAILARDSTGASLAPYLVSSYERVVQLRHYFDEPDRAPDIVAEVTEQGADVVYFVLAERYLDVIPNFEERE